MTTVDESRRVHKQAAAGRDWEGLGTFTAGSGGPFHVTSAAAELRLPGRHKRG